MLAFRSEAHLNTWLSRRNLMTGYIMSLQQCFSLAGKWYPNRSKLDWKRPGAADTQKLFESLDLKGDFWKLGP
ncbi:MAG: hypothetical protein D3926_02095 [Desulfobacteraceae bacterium]|nr:MAG: hypothetical protein D3926_02095 [Desulfobacteraceae bacterium]